MHCSEFGNCVALRCRVQLRLRLDRDKQQLTPYSPGTGIVSRTVTAWAYSPTSCPMRGDIPWKFTWVGLRQVMTRNLTDAFDVVNSNIDVELLSCLENVS